MSPVPARHVLHGPAARAALLVGVDAVADAVRVTLGPAGRTVLLRRSPDPATGFEGGLTITNDGVTIAREVVLGEPFAEQGAQFLRDAARATNDAAGDGTTTTTLLAQALLRDAVRAVEAGMSAVALRRGIERAVAQAIEHLREQAVAVTTTEQTVRVATVASADAEAGETVAEAFAELGVEGVVAVEAGGTRGLELEVVEGLRWDQGFVAPDMVTDAERVEAVLEDPYVLLVDAELSSAHALLPLVEQVKEAGRPLLVVAQEISGEALAMLLVNTMLGHVRCAAVRAPEFALRRRRILDDIAVFTGGVTVSEETGFRLESMRLEQLGRARRVIAERMQTTIVGGAGDPAEIAGRLASLRHEAETADVPFHAKMLRERHDRLAAKVALVRVGAATETEILERLLRVEDAVHATRAALEEGLVPGGGVALLDARAAIDPAAFDGDEAVGAAIVRRALEHPLRQIADNAGWDGSVAVLRLDALPAGHGLDARTGEYADLTAAGVVDPLKVVRCALENAASVAKTVLAAEAVVVEAARPPAPVST